MTASFPKLSEDFFSIFTHKTVPFLTEHGWDDCYGGLFESLNTKGEHGREDFRRVMLHGRQLFVFSRWAGLTHNENFKAMANKIFEYMTNSFWDTEYGGWYSRVTIDGSPADSTKDLYAHAFVLFGLIHHARYVEKQKSEYWIEKTLSVLAQHFLRPDGSYKEKMNRYFADETVNQRYQNPHMHLFEAALALCEYKKTSENYSFAVSLLALFNNKFLDQKNMIIREFLDKNFNPDNKIGHIIEPGHHYEWAWLLSWAAETLERSELNALGKSILDRSLKFGWDRAHNGVFDQVNARDFSVWKNSKRLWPVLELIKALNVFLDNKNRIYLGKALEILMTYYFKKDGTWTEHYSFDWKVLSDGMPVSSAYHLGMASLVLNNLNDS